MKVGGAVTIQCANCQLCVENKISYAFDKCFPKFSVLLALSALQVCLRMRLKFLSQTCGAFQETRQTVEGKLSYFAKHSLQGFGSWKEHYATDVASWCLWNFLLSERIQFSLLVLRKVLPALLFPSVAASGCVLGEIREKEEIIVFIFKTRKSTIKFCLKDCCLNVLTCTALWVVELFIVCNQE